MTNRGPGPGRLPQPRSPGARAHLGNAPDTAWRKPSAAPGRPGPRLSEEETRRTRVLTLRPRQRGEGCREGGPRGGLWVLREVPSEQGVEIRAAVAPEQQAAGPFVPLSIASSFQGGDGIPGGDIAFSEFNLGPRGPPGRWGGMRG